VDVRLLDDEGREVEEGEVCVRGPIVMQGYWRNPQATAEALRDGWLRTGDIARRDEEGFLYIVDRKKDLIVSGGFNVFSREVETALEEHPSVKQAAVIGVPHERWGEAVTAFVVPREGETIDAEALINRVKELRGPFMAPKTIEVMTSLPLTQVGKVDKQALRRPYWAGQERNVN
jgi:fatty-acyl-CoA synthase